MNWPEYTQSPVDWDPAWNEWVGLPGTPRSAKTIKPADHSKTEAKEDEELLPDALEYQQLVLSKVGEMERYRPPVQKRNRQQRPAINSRDSEQHIEVHKPAAKPGKRSTVMQQVRKAALMNSRPIALQSPSQRHAERTGKGGRHRSKAKVYGGSAAASLPERSMDQA